VSKNSTNLSDKHFATHNLSDATLKIGTLEGEQLGIRLSWQEVERLAAFIREEQRNYEGEGQER
jgi:hypothetical protein